MTTKHTDHELLERVRKAINATRAVMVGVADGDVRPFAPMKGHVVEGESPVWFICRNTVTLVQALGGETRPAILNVVSEDHHLHASAVGALTAERDQARIDLFWNSVADAWLPEGRTSPNVILLRFEPADVEVWISDSSFKLAWEVAKANFNREQADSGERASIHLA